VNERKIAEQAGEALWFIAAISVKILPAIRFINKACRVNYPVGASDEQKKYPVDVQRPDG